MVNFAIVEAGIVANATVAEEAYGLDQGWIPLEAGFGPGDLWNGTSFSHPPADPAPPATAEENDAALLDRRINSLMEKGDTASTIEAILLKLNLKGT